MGQKYKKKNIVFSFFVLVATNVSSFDYLLILCSLTLPTPDSSSISYPKIHLFIPNYH